MTYRVPIQASSGPAEKSGFKRVEPLADGPRALAESERRQAFSSFFPRRAGELAMRFEDARAKLYSLYGARVEIVETAGGGMKLSAKLEFLTEDRSLDADLDQKVAGRGFSLKLHSVPVTAGSPEEVYERRVRQDGGGGRIEYAEQRMLRKYVITESERTSQVDCAVTSVEGLLELAATLRPAGISEDLPGNVVSLESARASRPPPGADAQEPRAGGAPLQRHGGKAS
ncbi:hypothetical protein L0Y65_06775 [Candidatus Micrarchaeota archaeon]|nr:hypothetical protein [Candidatus Micrarchaeota archaeon]